MNEAPEAPPPARRVGEQDSPALIKVLVVANDPTRAGVIARGLHAASCAPLLAFSADQGARCLALDAFRLVVIDCGRGLELADLVAALRSEAIPVLMVGGEETALALPGGIELRLAATATSEEVVARAVAMVSVQRPVSLPILRWGELELDVLKRVAHWRGSSLSLTVTEFRIMEVLVLAAGSVVRVGDLVRRVWGCEQFQDKERVLAHIRRIRKKIEADPSHPRILLTVRGEGFRLTDDEISQSAIDLTRLDRDVHRRIDTARLR